MVDPERSGLFDAFARDGFAVTAELAPPRGADPDGLREKAELLRGWVDAVNITDNQGARIRMSSLAGSVLALRAGIEPIMQITGRDRNRLAVQSDLIGASALGVRNILLLTGDHPSVGDDAEAKPVFDLDSVQLVWTARTMRDEKQLLSGRKVDPPPAFHIGAVENPFAPPADFRPTRLGKKVAAGAEFVQTQFVFDVATFAAWMARVRELGLHERCKVLAGVGPIRSPRALEHMRTGVPGLHIPDAVAERLLAASDFEQAGIAICAEIIEQVREIPGVAGVHMMAFGNEEAVPKILQRAGVREGVSGRAG